MVKCKFTDSLMTMNSCTLCGGYDNLTFRSLDLGVERNQVKTKLKMLFLFLLIYLCFFNLFLFVCYFNTHRLNLVAEFEKQPDYKNGIIIKLSFEKKNIIELLSICYVPISKYNLEASYCVSDQKETKTK